MAYKRLITARENSGIVQINKTGAAIEAAVEKVEELPYANSLRNELDGLGDQIAEANNKISNQKFKTINGNSILGEGNISILSPISYTIDEEEVE